MADTPKLTVSTDLAIVVNGDCGCFWKFYFEIEANNAPHVDGDIGPCQKHLRTNRDEKLLSARRALYLTASDLAKNEADRIRGKVNQ